jgi:hypothetical protein
MAIQLTNDERVRAALGQFETNKQATEIYDKLLKETKQEIAKLKKEDTTEARLRVTELERTINFVETAKSNIGTGKAIVGGLVSGAIDLGAFPIDIVSSIFGGPSFGETAKKEVTRRGLEILPGTIPAERATTAEAAPFFGAARGVVQLPLRTPVGTAIQAGAYGLAGGVDETGIATGTLAIGQLLQGLYQAGRVGLSAKEQRDLVKTLPEEQKNAFAQFMLRGQQGTDPQTAALIQRLKTNPETAEIMNALEEGAKRTALTGMAPIATEGKVAGPIYNAIQQRIKALNYKISGKEVQSKFDRAKEIAGDKAVANVPVEMQFAIPETTTRIDELIARFNAAGGDTSAAAVRSLEALKTRLLTDGNPTTTISKIQGNLTSFGERAAGEANLLKDVTITDQKQIAAGIFSALKTDLGVLKKSPDVTTRKAALTLDQAREMVRKGWDEKSNFLAQGLPADLQKTNLDALDDVEFTNLFGKLTTDQRNKILPILEAQAPEAVDRIRLANYNKFLQGATKRLDTGDYGVDFEKLVNKYNTLKPEERELLAFSLGSNSKEFAERMDDATKFFRYNMKIRGVPEEGQMLTGEQIAKGQAAVGAVTDYATAKAADVGLRLFNDLSGNMKDTDVLRILLTKEGKDFLKTAKLSPAGEKTLQNLEQLRLKDIPLPSAAINLQRGFQTLTQQPEQAPELTMPEETFAPVSLPSEESTGGFAPVPLPQ